jgi:Protein of unknown function (DUF2786)
MDSDAKLNTIRKLLAMAEAEGLTDAARETYTAKAADLIAQYGIDRALVEATGPTRAEASDVMIDIDAPYWVDKAVLLHRIAEPLGCRTVRMRGQQRVHLFGMAADLERVQMLFTSLLVQQAFALAGTPVPAGENPRAYRSSWMNGYSREIFSRLLKAEIAARAEAEPRAQAAGTSTALVLADRKALVDRRVDATYERLTTTPRRLSGSGGRAGRAAGARADLGGRNRVAAASRTALPGGSSRG